MIERYAQAILTPWLHSKKLPTLAIASMANAVRARLHSALSGWSEANRATLLMPAREEATFYEPRSASLDVRALVVLCIRDSKIEDWFSTGSGLAEPLHDAAVRELTAAAIAYFSKQPAAAFAAGQGQPVGQPGRRPLRPFQLDALAESKRQEIMTV